MSLKFDISRMVEDLKKNLENSFDKSLDHWEQNVIKLMRPEAIADFKAQIKANKTTIINKIMLYLEANPGALADTFGTGSKMDTKGNPYFNEYFSGANRGNAKGNVNPLRTDTTIVGRPEGKYVDIFGNEHTVENDGLSGVPIEGNTYVDENGKKVKIQAIKPSHAIQDGTELFYNEIMIYCIPNALKSLRLGKYITEVNKK